MNDKAWPQWVNELEPIFKKKCICNAIYELIMLSKVAVIAKLELLTTTLIFWNSRTNTFDFRIGPMSLTILDMTKVFRLQPSGRVVDITHDWCLSFTFKSYETSFTGFIPFVKKTFRPSSSNANRD